MLTASVASNGLWTVVSLVGLRGSPSASPPGNVSLPRSARWRICLKPCAKATIPFAPALTIPHEPMGEVMQQVNAMAATLRAQRLGALEATALLRKVMEEIEVAVFAFDPQQTLRLVNRAGERLLAQPAERLLARDATSLGLAEYLVGELEQTISRSFPGGSGPLGHSPQQFPGGRRSAPIACAYRSDPAPCAKKNCRPGSGWSACWATS